jgi:nitroimidazol reductase NimA-like FMN-containing flavoprotein (pyridoxamine 5'-phosphate oxidase superfamily)
MQQDPDARSVRARDGVGRGPKRSPTAYADPVDDALDDTFPASDPPSWTLGPPGDPTPGPVFRTLDRAACEAILSRNHVGRIAYAQGHTTAIVPVYYAYAEGWIYGRMRRARKRAIVGWHGWWPVAFQVDEVEDLFHWRTVHVHGGLYALPPDGPKAEQEARRHAIDLLRRLIPRTFRAGDPMPAHTGVFRIAVQEISGSEALPEAEGGGA